jgi:hypothetical protein
VGPAWRACLFPHRIYEQGRRRFRLAGDAEVSLLREKPRVQRRIHRDVKQVIVNITIAIIEQRYLGSSGIIWTGYEEGAILSRWPTMSNC